MNKVFFFALALVFLLVSPRFAYAHFEKHDRDITVELHVDPDDNPIPGEQSHLYFLFDDKTKKFQLPQCNCIVSISEQGKQIYQQQLVEKKDTHPSIWGASMPFTFPRRDVYHITITGTPQTMDGFQKFTLSWDFRVDQNNVLGLSTQERPADPTFIYFMLGFLSIPILGGIGVFFIMKHS